MIIKFTVPAVPIAQPRQRHAVVRGQIRNYTPAKHPVTAFKATVRMAFQQVYKGPPLTGPLQCSLVFVLPRPQNLIWKKREMPRVHHIKKPDVDNLAKSVFDSLSQQAFIDDTQICQVSIEKWVAAGDEQPHVEITLQTIEGD